MRGVGPKALLAVKAVAGVQVIQCGKEPFEIVGAPCMDEVQVKRIDWRAIQYGSYALDDQKVDRVVVESS